MSRWRILRSSICCCWNRVGERRDGGDLRDDVELYRQKCGELSAMAGQATRVDEMQASNVTRNV